MLGAGLFAANLSTTFRLRKFGMTDKVPYAVTLRVETPGASGGEDGEPDGGVWRQGVPPLQLF